MTFYLQPPSGNVSYQKLEEFGLNRFRFLARLVACKDEEERKEAVLDAETVNWSECIISGSVKDKISHFVLRLALAHDVNFTQFLCDAETILFRMRLDSFSSQDWLSFFETLRKHLSRHQNENLNDICVFFNSLCNEFTSWPSLVEGMKNIEDESKFVDVPFQLVLRLVAERRVVLKQGYASLPLCLVPDVLEQLFKSLMIKMVQLTRQQQQKIGHVDSRMSRLSAVLKRSYQREVNLTTLDIPLGSKALTLDSMTSSQVCFPLCMSQLMATLEKHHRLCHQDRIQLTLFMKELGLPVHQALLFWKREYSKPSIVRLNGVSCGHDWQGNERRYIYNIRHLYGLEGKRVSYTAHSCASIQGRQLSCVDSGGCPFTALDPPALTRVLSEEGMVESDIEDVLLHVNKGCVAGACTRTACHKMKLIKNRPNKSYSTSSHHRHFSDSTGINQDTISCSSCLSCQNKEKSSPLGFNSQHSNDDRSDDNDFLFPLSQSSRFVTSDKFCYNSKGYRNKTQARVNCGHDKTRRETDGDDVLIRNDCDKSEKGLDFGVSNKARYIRRKGCVHGIDCDSCKKKRKLHHCCDDDGNEKYSKFNFVKMNNHVTIGSTDESEIKRDFQKCEMEITAGASFKTNVRNNYQCDLHSFEDEKSPSCDLEKNYFTCDRHPKSFKHCFDTEKCKNCNSENDLQYKRQTELCTSANNLRCKKNKSGGVHCNVMEREMFYEDGTGKISNYKQYYDDDNRFTNNFGSTSKFGGSFRGQRRKPSSIYWDVKSFADS